MPVVTDDLLATLKDTYEGVDTPPVLAFLDYHEDVMRLVHDAVSPLRQHFPGCRYALHRETGYKADGSGNAEDDELYVIIWFTGEVDDALARMDALYDWQYYLPYDTRHIDVHFDIGFGA